MRIEEQMQMLINNGFSFNTIKNLDKKGIKVLSELFNKAETKEAIVKTTIPPGEKITADVADVQKAGLNIDGTNITMKDGKIIARKGGDKTEGEMTERFESKAQQGLFWAKCKNSKGKTKEKWCEMAKEFSDSTSKKEYKNMPEKKHPEKTVKKTTKENYEKFLENRIVNMLDNHINPSMTKDRLIQSINERKKSEPFMLKQPKKNTMFSQDEGKEMKTKTEFKEQTTAPVKPGTKERTKEKSPGKKTPFKPKYNPAPKAGKGELPNWLTWNKLGVNLK